MDKVINMKNVSWRRNKQSIITEVNWSIAKGENWAVLGLNGSGKTTLLNMLNGYIWPTTGKISVLGYEYGRVNLGEVRKLIGWVSSSLQVRMNERELTQDIVISGKYASIGLYEEPTEEDKEKSMLLMKQLGCSHVINRSYQTCSQGERQKLLIARALMASPKILILDEASNGLDFISREALLMSINELATQENAPTIIYVTHHIEEITSVFTHTLLVRQGGVFEKGKTENVLKSDILSNFFESPVQIDWHNSRAWLSIPR